MFHGTKNHSTCELGHSQPSSRERRHSENDGPQARGDDGSRKGTIVFRKKWLVCTSSHISYKRTEYQNPHFLDAHHHIFVDPPLTHRSGRNFSGSNRCLLFKRKNIHSSIPSDHLSLSYSRESLPLEPAAFEGNTHKSTVVVTPNQAEMVPPNITRLATEVNNIPSSDDHIQAGTAADSLKASSNGIAMWKLVGISVASSVERTRKYALFDD